MEKSFAIKFYGRCWRFEIDNTIIAKIAKINIKIRGEATFLHLFQRLSQSVGVSCLA